MNILYTFNDKFVPQVAASICSICENNKSIENITFYLITMDISNKNKIQLKKFINSYNRKVEIFEIADLHDYFNFEFDTLGWNKVIIARLLMGKILPKNVEKILYLDGDTIVRDSLDELWHLNLCQKTLGMSIEPTVDKKRKQDLGLAQYHYYNSGVLLVDLKRWRDIDAEKLIMDYYKKHKGLLFAADQDAINGALKDEIYTILPKYNFYNIFYHYSYTFLKNLEKPLQYISKEEFEECKKNPVIIHYLGEERPWRNGNTHKYKNDYEKYLSLTPWKNTTKEKGWVVYFFCWNIFNFITKLFPRLRYNIINYLIPKFMKYRTKKLKQEVQK